MYIHRLMNARDWKTFDWKGVIRVVRVVDKKFKKLYILYTKQTNKIYA